MVVHDNNVRASKGCSFHQIMAPLLNPTAPPPCSLWQEKTEPTVCLNSIDAPKMRERLIAQPSATQIFCFLIASTPLELIVVCAIYRLLIPPWQPWDIRRPGKRFGQIRRIGSNWHTTQIKPPFIISFNIVSNLKLLNLLRLRAFFKFETQTSFWGSNHGPKHV